MKLQLALDRMTIHEAIAIAEIVRPYVDWLEVGTSLIKEFGMESLRQFRQAFPDKFIVADIKTFDNAAYEFSLCFDYGADAATVIGAAPLVTIETCKRIAAERERLCMIDLLNAPSKQLPFLFDSPHTAVCIHISKDQQEQGGHGSFEHSIEAYTPFLSSGGPKLAVAGGITSDSLPLLQTLRPDVVIVGTGITQAVDPLAAAKALYQSVHSHS
ncbi:orotidine 5'-phosphate decarboxylase / HUMPS family protein [Paenibacillus abyssi]|uniref:3-hexulose-6-phosphate synthase n=1 Tax=Paenibacillus abyssi TaxID=1340531 RepID=A0A917CZX6_9BACL|nr:orotidine 5'-phosphate decarboxylase / HUMPS family protein [Paenibacillus abyssi]GGG03927.1 3-hexulose-6-phosphate synthase [Paenibacillus abyssi]